ncbi:MAG: hypothetical protein WD942_11270 [Dehalococcoidia bacterium]
MRIFSLEPRWLALMLLFALSACGGDDAVAPVTYESLAGTYVGDMAGETQGVTLVGDFSITINQNDGQLTGSWSLVGTLSDGSSTVDIQGTGPLSGTVASGANPSVNITFTNNCPGYEARFSGAYDGANRLLTISGPVDVLNDDCSLFLRYPSTILLAR